jgi:predicted dehydrogenase
MDRGNLSRRGFLQRSLAALAAAGLPAWYAREVFAAEEAKAAAAGKRAGDSDEIIMGAIGIGSPASRGRDIYNAARGHKGVCYVACCDVDLCHRRIALDMMKHDGFTEATSYKDFRDLLDRKDIHAVTIATPDHWHALVALDAMRKGKDIYCEKPLTLTIEEGKALVKTAHETGRVFQVGSQQRSDSRFRMACELVRNGRIGKIQRVETRIGDNPQSPPLTKCDPPEGFDYDFWLGPTPKVDYVELYQGGRRLTRCHYEFRWWYDYSGGKMTDWGAHHNDIAQWGLGMDGSGPVAVEATGTPPATEPNRYNCHQNFVITYTYDNGAKLVCSSHQQEGSLDPKEGPGKQSHDNGVLFVGEDNKWIFVSRGTIEASDKKLIDEPLPGSAEKLYVSNDHMGNFLECMKSRKKPICDVEIGHRSVTVCHIGVIALRTGKKLKWDPKEERFDDEEANKMLRREMRAPWKLEA